MKINTKYSINDSLYIIPLKIKGKVLSIYISEFGISYNIRYFHEFKSNDCYFYESELQLEEPKQEIGFKSEIK